MSADQGQAKPLPSDPSEDGPGAAAVAEAEGDEQFLQILKVVLQQVPPEAEVQDPLRRGMVRHWLTPPVPAMRLLLGDESLSLLDCRRCLFYPSEEDARTRYPRLVLSPPQGLEFAEQHPQRQAQAPALTLLYFIHQHSWPIVREFILGGGLQSFTGILTDANLYVRAQAVEIFYRISNGYGDAFDWWRPPTAPEDMGVHRKMFELLHLPFVQRLLDNLRVAETFPGGSYLCLQLLAFWLSYVRRFWTRDNVLRLSQETLATLEAHAAVPDLPAEETELASKLHADFSRWPALEAMGENEMRDTAAGGSPLKPPEAAGAAAPVPTPDLLKEQGNALFKSGSWDAAAALYSAAIDLARNQGNTEPRALAVYHSNRAAVAARLWEQTERPMEERLRQAQSCVTDCDAALQCDPLYLKAHFRKSTLLLDVALALEGPMRCQYLRQAASAVGKAQEVAPGDEAVAELAQRITAATAEVPVLDPLDG